MITLSLVVPCYNESAVLHIFMTELKRVLDGLGNVKPEVIFVNDGSRDDTLSILRELHRSYPDIVRYYSLSRNFGKEGAMLAGLTHATGNYVAIMDADLQDPPALLPDMLKWVTEEGYDCVGTRRSTREGEPPVRSFFARCFYWLINKISDTKLESGARDYKLLSRRALQALLSLPERNRFSKGLYEWIGFRTKCWSITTWSVPPAKPSGRSGSSSAIRWRAFWPFQPCLWLWPLCWDCSSWLSPLSPSSL